MTQEEAIEVILGGDPWMDCPHCGGKGLLMIEGAKSEATEGAQTFYGPFFKMCLQCCGGKQTVKPHYARACLALGRPIPKTTQQKFNATNDQTQELQQAISRIGENLHGVTTIHLPKHLNLNEGDLVFYGEPEGVIRVS